jgi:integrase
MRIYPRGARGILWVDLTVDGERLKRSTGTTDRRQAEEYAATLARDLWRSKRLGETPRVTWDTAVIEWVAEHGHRRSIEDIKLRLSWLSDRLQGKPLASITDVVIRELARDRKAQAIDKAGKASSNATVNRHLAELSKILHYAHRRGWLPGVPPIAKMHEPAKRVAWLTREQAGQLLLELPPHLRAMAGFALATGLRETNVRLLCWQQVDIERRTAWVFADQAKAGKDLAVPLNDAAMLVLRHQQGLHSRWVFPVPRWEEKKKPEDKPRQTLDAPTGKISSQAWRKACTRAGVPWLRFHDLRHTWASWHVQAGTPLPVLRELGGWATLAMVERYAHLGVSHVATWAGNIGGTNPVQVAGPGTKQNGPEGPSTEVEKLGWLMGLEPTTTGITKRSQRGQVLKINSLAASRKRKTG